MKRFCTILAALALILFCAMLLPTEAQAAETVAYGACGDNLTWILDTDGTLIISGTGEMWDYSDDYWISTENGPWAELDMPINKVIIEEGVTSVGRAAFIGSGLKSIYIPSSVQYFGAFAFRECFELTAVYVCDEEAWKNTDFEIGTFIISFAPGFIEVADFSSNPTSRDMLSAGATLYCHEWVGGNCVSQATCAYCGIGSGSNQHVWIDASCASPKFCFVCGETEGDYGHVWMDATCLTAKTCSECGETEGTALGHSWKDANCLTPKTCTVCSTTEGTSAGHNWAAATCTTPKTCQFCGLTEGTIQHS